MLVWNLNCTELYFSKFFKDHIIATSFLPVHNLKTVTNQSIVMSFISMTDESYSSHLFFLFFYEGQIQFRLLFYFFFVLKQQYTLQIRIIYYSIVMLSTCFSLFSIRKKNERIDKFHYYGVYWMFYSIRIKMIFIYYNE